MKAKQKNIVNRFKVTEKQLNSIVLSAFDYALGRSSYATSIVSDIIVKTKPFLTVESIRYISMKVYMSCYRGDYGMDMDLEIWLNMADKLRPYLIPDESNSDSTQSTDTLVDVNVGAEWFWFTVGSAFRYDLRTLRSENYTHDRLSISDYREFIESNLSEFNEKWRVNLIRDIDDSGEFDFDRLLEEERIMRQFLLDLRIDGKTLSETDNANLVTSSSDLKFSGKTASDEREEAEEHDKAQLLKTIKNDGARVVYRYDWRTRRPYYVVFPCEDGVTPITDDEMGKILLC